MPNKGGNHMFVLPESKKLAVNESSGEDDLQNRS